MKCLSAPNQVFSIRWTSGLSLNGPILTPPGLQRQRTSADDHRRGPADLVDPALTTRAFLSFNPLTRKFTRHYNNGDTARDGAHWVIHYLVEDRRHNKIPSTHSGL